MKRRKTVTPVALTSALLIAFGGQALGQSQNLEKLKQILGRSDGKLED